MVAEGDADVIGAEIADPEVEVVASFIGNDGSACAVRASNTIKSITAFHTSCINE